MNDRNPFEDLRARMNAVRANTGQILRESVRETAPIIEDSITDQLSRGERGDGEMLPDYSPVSVNVFGKRPGPMTLKNTGDFYHEIRIVWDDNGFTVENNDWKASMLATTYGKEILEIQPESFLFIRDESLTDAIMFNINKVFINGSI